jgi:hypothetical protein
MIKRYSILLPRDRDRRAAPVREDGLPGRNGV